MGNPRSHKVIYNNSPIRISEAREVNGQFRNLETRVVPEDTKLEAEETIKALRTDPQFPSAGMHRDVRMSQEEGYPEQPPST